MWLELCRNDFRCVLGRLNRCIESTSACFESPYKETIVNGYIYTTPGVEKHRVTWRTPLKPVTQLQIARIAEQVSFPNA